MLYTNLFVYAWIAIILSILYTTLIGESVFPLYMVDIVLLAILPIIYRLIAYIRETPDESIRGTEYIYTEWLVSILLSLIIIVSVRADTLTLLSLVLTIQVLIRGIDGRYLFSLALGYIVAVPLLLIMQQQGYAEYLSIQAYYALVLGTITLLVWDRISRVVRYYMAPIAHPRWWDEYRREITVYLLFGRRYLPFVFLILISLVASPWRDILSYDERFIATVTVLLWLLGLMRDTRREWYLPYILVGVAGASYFALFSEALIEWAIGLILYIAILYAMHRYRTQIAHYRKHLSSYLIHE